MGYLNFFATRLATDIGSSDTTIAVETVPAVTDGRLVLEARNPTQREIISYTGISGNDLTGVTRGLGGTTAKAHLQNALVEMNLTAEDIDDLYTAFETFVAPSGNGWVDTVEAWAYASWTAGTRTGTITVPTDATTKYSPGMKIRISQTTGGTKYGIITKVEAVTLTVYFGTDYTLNNETVSSPYYSVQKAPFGFPLDPDKWTVTATSTTSRSTSSSTLATLTDTIVVPIGAWNLKFKAMMYFSGATTANSLGMVTLSSDGSTETNPNLNIMEWKRASSSTATSAGGGTRYAEDFVAVTSATTFTMMGKVNSGGPAINIYEATHAIPTLMQAICAYL